MTGESTSYSYDSLNRLTSASNSLWSQTYGYDGFGNMTSKSYAAGSPKPSQAINVSYNASNQVVGASYDGNGNLTVANGATNAYSVENRLNNQNSQTWPYASTMYGYDPSGKRVMERVDPDPDNLNGGSNPTWQFYFYGITGQRLVTVSCNNQYTYQPWPSCTTIGQNVYFGGKLMVSNGVNVVTDRMGSVRANTQGESFAYYPYGEERTNTVNLRDKFGTYFRDSAGQDYADQRYYGVGTGRFPTPDRGHAKLGDPDSWNRYSYVEGDPVNRFDPLGRAACEMDDNVRGARALDYDDTSDCDTPSGGGGGYVFSTTVTATADDNDDDTPTAGPDPTDDPDPDNPPETPVPAPQQPARQPGKPNCPPKMQKFFST